MNTPILKLVQLAEAQSEPSIPINANLRLLEAVIQLAVISILNAPPLAPAEGDRYIVGTAPTGAWAAQANAVAYLSNGAWLFAPPLPGWLAYIGALGKHYRFLGGSPAGWSLAF